MRRVIYLLIAVGVAAVVVGGQGSGARDQGSAVPSSPPGPGSEWTQEDWNRSPPTPGLPFGGPMGWSGSMPGPADIQQRMLEMQRQIERMQAQTQADRDNNIRQVLGVGDAQWAQIKPRLERIDSLKAEVNASFDPGGGFSGSSRFVSGTTPGGAWSGGGWTDGGFGFSTQMGPNNPRRQAWNSGTPAQRAGSTELTAAERICQELHNLLQNPNVAPAQIAQKIGAFRQAKERAQRELTRERKDLRSLLNFRQEAALIVMGYLD